MIAQIRMRRISLCNGNRVSMRKNLRRNCGAKAQKLLPFAWIFCAFLRIFAPNLRRKICDAKIAKNYLRRNCGAKFARLRRKFFCDRKKYVQLQFFWWILKLWLYRFNHNYTNLIIISIFSQCSILPPKFSIQLKLESRLFLGLFVHTILYIYIY